MGLVERIKKAREPLSPKQGIEAMLLSLARLREAGDAFEPHAAQLKDLLTEALAIADDPAAFDAFKQANAATIQGLKARSWGATELEGSALYAAVRDEFEGSGPIDGSAFE